MAGTLVVYDSVSWEWIGSAFIHLGGMSLSRVFLEGRASRQRKSSLSGSEREDSADMCACAAI